MLANSLTLDTTELVKTTFSTNGTFYRGVVDDNLSLVARYQRTKKGQNRTNIAPKVMKQFIMPSGASADSAITASFTLAHFDVATDEEIQKAIDLMIAAVQIPDFIKQLRRGEQ